jgi:hypothetical protein
MRSYAMLATTTTTSRDESLAAPPRHSPRGFSPNRFCGFVDDSPIREVAAERALGLGRPGKTAS